MTRLSTRIRRTPAPGGSLRKPSVAEPVVEEVEVQAEIMKHFAEHDMETDSPPIVAVGPHAGNPHHETSSGQGREIREGDFVLIDLWAKLQKPRAVYSDLTRVGFVGKTVPPTNTRKFSRSWPRPATRPSKRCARPLPPKPADSGL